MAYQLPIYGFKFVSGGDFLVFDETTLKVYDGNTITREYSWDNFKYAEYNYIHVFPRKRINVYYLYFDDGKKVLVCPDENSEAFQKLLQFEPRRNIRNAKYINPLVGLTLLVVMLFVVFANQVLSR